MIYESEFLNEISFPLGGIGSGSIGLEGNGSLSDWEIFNRPDKGSINGYTHIAVKVKTKDNTYVKLLNSDTVKELSGRYTRAVHSGVSSFGQGADRYHMSGFPHFKSCSFKGEFPIAELTFSDSDFPGEVLLRAFNPFIPLDSKNSSIPAAFFEIEYKNESEEELEFQGVFALTNPFDISKNEIVESKNISSVKLINAGKNRNEKLYGDLSLSCEDASCVQKYWYRGSWMDGLSTYWKEFSKTDGFIKRDYDKNGSKDVACISKTLVLKPGEKKSVRFVVSWNIPNNFNYWSGDEKKSEKIWKNYYATVFEDSVASGQYSIENWDMLYKKTKIFKDELFSCSIPDSFKDAVASTMSVLKSPTVFRLENGEFYGFEGVLEQYGSCEGTCQHVWNYAYALCFLFPELERSIRDLEFKYATLDSGETKFRLSLPLEKAAGNFRSCVDGHMGCVIKTYREWKISGNNEWLRGVWKTVEKIMDFAWSEENKDKWDIDKDGVLEGRQHHTLDMELFGPSSWLEGFYLAALKAAAEMADFLGYSDKADEYMSLYENGRKWTKENLFNGEYFIQKIDIKDKSVVEKFGCTDVYWNEEQNEIKYQIAEGSSIDQLTAQWHANICGLGDIFDNKQVKTALLSMMKNNYKPSMREVTNMWRIFAINDESGAIICDYPEGTYKPVIPVPYCEECMTGFEYQFAGLLISEGYIEEGIKIVEAIRDRYDGKKRNPWNEIECGSNYARAMASFALLPIMSGFKFDIPHNKIGFNPVVSDKYFRCVWFLESGWGNIIKSDNSMKINLLDGNLLLSCLEINPEKTPSALIIDGEEKAFTFENGQLIFEKTTVEKCIDVVI